jgi:hypothetical protein
MRAVIVAGTALTLVTFGAAAPAAAAADAAVVGAGAAAEGTAAAAAGAAAGAAAEGGGAAVAGAAAEGAAVAGAAAGEGAGAAAAEGAAAGAGEVAAGAGEGGAAAAAASAPAAATPSWMTGANFGIQVLAGTVQGAGTSGLQYDIQHGRDFTAGGFFESVGWGALGGALSGGITGLPSVSSLTTGVSAGGKFILNVAVNALAGGASAAFTNTMQNLADHNPWYQGLAAATALGIGEGALLSGIAQGVQARIGDSLTFEVSEKNIGAVNSMLDRVQAAATTSDAYMCYGTAGFFIASGFLIGTTIGLTERGNQN